MTRAAYLRMYLPADIADETGQGFVDPDHPGHPSALRAARYGLVSESLDDDGYMTEWRGERWVCPRHARLRMLQGVLAFHNAYAEAGGRFVIPESTARRAAEELDRLCTNQPGLRSHILTSAWHVPPRWFLCFVNEEKEIVDTAGGKGVRYRTGQSSAAERLRRALDALKRAGFTEAITGEIEELFDWVQDFSAEAMVELHYGSVSGLFSEGDLVLDDSAEEIWASVEALERGDVQEAQSRYLELAGRWSQVLAVGYNS